jgi:hypothetical protein
MFNEAIAHFETGFDLSGGDPAFLADAGDTYG